MTHDLTTLEGAVTAVFAHRFVVQTASGAVLADLGPEGAARIGLEAGDHVALAGERKPSELKVHSIARNGAPAIPVPQRRKPAEAGHGPVDPAAARQAVERNGVSVLGEARRKPRHFEILGRDAAGELVESHVDLDGTLRKTRAVDAADPKWAADIAAALT